VCSIPKDVGSRSDFVALSFDEAHGRVPKPVETQVTLRALERPVFAYGYQMVDNRSGNGDGRVQKGENFTMYLTVKNIGKGRSYETQVNLKNLSGDGVLLHEGRFDVSNLAPGESRKLAFTFDVQPKIESNEAKFEISVSDRDLRETVGEKIRLPISLPAAFTPASGTVKSKGGDVFLLESPDATGRVFGKLTGSAEVMAKVAEFTKVKLDASRFAFVRTADVADGGAASSAGLFDDVMGHMPPNFEIAPPEVATRATSVTVRGSVSDGNRILDGYVFVGSRKIFYQSNRNGADPKKMAFQTDVPLRPGINVITVVARESADTTGRRTFVVRRDGPNGEYLATPKNDDELSENAGAGDD
ncbi:MAG: peptidase S41, partial [Proteobacteria bacterium]